MMCKVLILPEANRKEDFLQHQLNACVLLLQKKKESTICTAITALLGFVALLYVLYFSVLLSKFVYTVFPKVRIYI